MLLNGVSIGFFEGSRGLRQGDTLSPPLFLLVAEVLGRMLTRASEHRIIEGFKVGVDRVDVTHFQYADDTLILCDNSQRQIRLLRCILHCFEAVSSLRMNLAKSSLITIGEVPNLDQLASDLGCRIGKLPITYLGLPLGSQYKRKEVCSPVLRHNSEKTFGEEIDVSIKRRKGHLDQGSVDKHPCVFPVPFCHSKTGGTSN